MLKQIVYTLTEFPDIDNVEVRLNGESVPLGKQIPTTTLTRRFFDDAKVAAPHDETRCGGSTEPTGKGKALRVPEASVDGSFVVFKGETTAKRGKIIVQLWQDNRLLRSLEGDGALYNQPDRGRHRSVRAVRRPARDPVGRDGRRRVQGHAAVRRRR